MELYRIICMLMIVAHHYVVNSGLASADGPLSSDFTSGKSLFLSLFGAWGKTGINCFLLITGYFMCTSKITLRKFLKLLGQIYLYKLVFYFVFLNLGYETVSLKRIVKLVMPVWGFNNNFVSCFIAFWLLIPFLSILVQNLSRRKHQLLLLLLLGFYTLLGSVPSFSITFNYMTWFCILFIVASFIRLHPRPVYERRKIWGWLTLLSVTLSVVSIVCLRLYYGERVWMGYMFMSDSNKILALAVAVCSFMWFKNLSISYSKVINALGAGTFGVLLIHANSNAMRTWLWKDVVDSVGHYYSMTTGTLALYSLGVVFSIFIVCNMIDQLRMATLEKWLLRWYDNKLSAKADRFINRITNDKDA